MTSEERVIDCPKCGREISAYVPKGGDGSAVRLRAHYDFTQDPPKPCAAGRKLVV